ncbi:hypothetical protein D5086_003764 [Populus alba]|uniref:Uncharacterized protein n=1 Tax=Populus alba TaxID=43335 RepID=A0ACC4D6Z2_POPAL
MYSSIVLMLRAAGKITIWGIWNRRNEQVRNNYSFSSYRAVQAGLNFLSSWSASRFTPPHIDAVVDNNQEAMGSSVCLA